MQWTSPRTLQAGVPLTVVVPLGGKPNWIVTIKNLAGGTDIESIVRRRVGLRTAGPPVTVSDSAETPIPLTPGTPMTFRGTGEAITSIEFDLTSAGGTRVLFEVNAPEV